jgi:hypothetical protein
MNRQPRDVVGAVGWLVFAIAVSVAALRLGVGRPSDPGPGFIFLWSAVMLGALAVGLLIRPTGEHEAGPSGADRQTMRIAAGAAVLFVYVLLFQTAGFLLTTVLMMGAIARLGEERRWSRIVTFAAAATAGAYVILQVWLGLRFPGGILG